MPCAPIPHCAHNLNCKNLLLHMLPSSRLAVATATISTFVFVCATPTGSWEQSDSGCVDLPPLNIHGTMQEYATVCDK